MQNEPPPILMLPLATTRYFDSYNPGNEVNDVLRELIENSIDANSSAIYISLENGGYSSIKVQDDGIGIPQPSLPNACKYYYTSKMRSIDDFDNLNTYGFRGKTLACFSCISNIIITTKTVADSGSNCCNYSFNIAINSSPCESDLVTGTIVELRDLLFNYPDIRKRRKRANTEAFKAEHLVLKYAILYPNLSFTLFSNAQKILEVPPSQHQAEILTFFRIRGMNHEYAFFHSTIETKIVKIEYYLANFTKNFINYARGIYLNNRLISCPEIKKAVDTIYNDFRQRNGFPFKSKSPYFFFLTIPIDKDHIDCYLTSKTVHFPLQYSIIDAIKQIVITEFKEAEKIAASNPQPMQSTPSSTVELDSSSSNTQSEKTQTKPNSISSSSDSYQTSPNQNLNQKSSSQNISHSYLNSNQNNITDQISINPPSNRQQQEHLLFNQRTQKSFSGGSYIEDIPVQLIPTAPPLCPAPSAPIAHLQDEKNQFAPTKTRHWDSNTNGQMVSDPKFGIPTQPSNLSSNVPTSALNPIMMTIPPNMHSYDELAQMQIKANESQQLYQQRYQNMQYQAYQAMQLQKASTDPHLMQNPYGAYHNAYMNQTPPNMYNQQQPIQMPSNSINISPFIYRIPSNSIQQYSVMQQQYNMQHKKNKKNHHPSRDDDEYIP